MAKGKPGKIRKLIVSELHIQSKNDSSKTYSINIDDIGDKLSFSNLGTSASKKFVINPDGTTAAVAPALTLTADNQIMTFGASNTLDPANQSVTFTASIIGDTGVVKFTAKNNSGTAVDLVDGSTDKTTLLTGANFGNVSSVTVTATATLDNDGSTLTDDVIISKVQSGVAGANGATGAAGNDAKAIKVTSNDYQIAYNKAGATPSPSSITITAAQQNHTGTFYYHFYVDNAFQVSNQTGSWTGLTVNSTLAAFGAKKVIKVETRTASAQGQGALLASDSITIIGTKDGSDAITVVGDNLSHTLPAENNGSVTSYAGSGINFDVYIGGTQLTANTSATQVSDLSANQFGITEAVSDIAVNNSPSATNSGKTYTFGVASAATQSADNPSITFSIFVKDSAGNSRGTIKQVQTFSKSKKGSTGATGTGAKVVTLGADKYIITYNGAGALSPGTQAIALTATEQGHSGTVYYQFLIDDVSKQNTTTATFTIGDSDEPSAGGSKTVKVKTREGSNSGTVISEDTISVFGVKQGADGKDAITIVMPNENHAFVANAAGTVSSYSGGGTDLFVFEGASRLTPTTNSLATSQFSVSVAETNIEVDDSPTLDTSGGDKRITYGDPTNMSADTAKLVYTVSVKNSANETYTFTKQQSFSKSKTGAAGANAKTVTVSANSGVFVKARAGTLSPSTITFTANNQNTTQNGSWSASAGTLTSVNNAHANASCVVTSGNFVDGMVVTYTLHSDDGSSSDSVTLKQLDEGSGNVQAVLSNEAHVLPASTAGAVSSYTGSGTTIQVYEGATALDFTTSTPAAGEFAVAIADTANITEGTASGNGTTTCTISDHSSAANGTDSYVITYTITGKTANGTTFTSFTKTQSLSKSKTGTTGATGSTGVAGADADVVKLTANDYQIAYDGLGKNPSPANNNSNTNLAFTATQQGHSGTYFYHWYVNGTWKQSGQTLTAPTHVDLTSAFIKTTKAAYGAKKVVKVLTRTSAVEDAGTLLASDSISVIATKEGSDAVTIDASNMSHVFQASNAGVVGSYAGSGCEFNVYIGNTQLNADNSEVTDVDTFAELTGSNSYTVASVGTNITPGSRRTTAAGKTMMVGYDSGGDTEHSGVSNGTDASDIAYTIFVKDANNEERGPFYGKQTFSKSKSGADGSGAKNIKLSVDNQAFSYADTNATTPTTPSPATLNFSLFQQNLDSAITNSNITIKDKDGNTLSRTFSFGGSVSSGTGTQTFSLLHNHGSSANALGTTASNAKAELPITITVERDSVKEELTVFKLEGGTDTISGFLTNESHVVSAGTDGTVASFSGAGGTFKVFKGTTDVTTSSTFSVVSVSGIDDDTDDVSDDGIDINSSNGVYSISGMSADTAIVVLRATYSGVNIDKTYTLAKSKTGTTGADGATAKLVKLIYDKQAFTYGSNGSASPANQVISITGSLQNTTATDPTWTITEADGDAFTNYSREARGHATATNHYHESFEGLSDGSTSNPATNGTWTNGLGSKNGTDVDNAFSWVAEDTDANSAGTGPDNAHSGSIYVFTEASGRNNKWYVMQRQFTSDQSKVVAKMSFTYHMYGAVMGNIKVWGSTNGSDWTQLSITKDVDGSPSSGLNVLNGQQHSAEDEAYKRAEVDLRSYYGSAFYVRITGYTGGSSFTSDASIDAISFIPYLHPTAIQITDTQFASNTLLKVKAAADGLDDEVTLVKLSDGAVGADAITCILTNESHTLQTSTAGVVTYTDSGTEIKVFKGTTELNSVTATPSTGQFKVTAAEVNIDAPTIGASQVSGNPVVIGDFTSMTADQAKVTYTINVENTVSLTKIQSFSKSKAGATGTNARSVKLEADRYVISYNAAGSESNTINFSTTQQNHSAAGTGIRYRFLVDGVEKQASSGTSTYTLLDGDEPSAGTSKKVTVETREGTDSGSAVATDSISVYGVQEGSDGADAITIILTNESHTVVTDSAGNVTDSYTGAGTEVIVYNGATRLTPQSGTGTASSGYFKVAPVATNITIGSRTDDTSGTDKRVTYAVPSSMTADNATITYTVTCTTAAGSFSFTKIQSYTKSKAGKDEKRNADFTKGLIGAGVLVPDIARPTNGQSSESTAILSEATLTVIQNSYASYGNALLQAGLSTNNRITLAKPFPIKRGKSYRFLCRVGNIASNTYTSVGRFRLQTYNSSNTLVSGINIKAESENNDTISLMNRLRLHSSAGDDLLFGSNGTTNRYHVYYMDFTFEEIQDFAANTTSVKFSLYRNNASSQVHEIDYFGIEEFEISPNVVDASANVNILSNGDFGVIDPMTGAPVNIIAGNLRTDETSMADMVTEGYDFAITNASVATLEHIDWATSADQGVTQGKYMKLHSYPNRRRMIGFPMTKVPENHYVEIEIRCRTNNGSVTGPQVMLPYLTGNPNSKTRFLMPASSGWAVAPSREAYDKGQIQEVANDAQTSKSIGTVTTTWTTFKVQIGFEWDDYIPLYTSLIISGGWNYSDDTTELLVDYVKMEFKKNQYSEGSSYPAALMPQKGDVFNYTSNNSGFGNLLSYGEKGYSFSQGSTSGVSEYSGISLGNNASDMMWPGLVNATYERGDFTSMGVIKVRYNLLEVGSSYTNAFFLVRQHSNVGRVYTRRPFFGPGSVALGSVMPIYLGASIKVGTPAQTTLNGPSTSEVYLKVYTRALGTTSWGTAHKTFTKSNWSSLSKTFTVDYASGWELAIEGESYPHGGSGSDWIMFGLGGFTVKSFHPSQDDKNTARLYELATLAGETITTFTGQHKCCFSGQKSDFVTGMIVSSIGTYDNMNFATESGEGRHEVNPQEAVPIVSISDIEKDKKVLGVVCGEWDGKDGENIFHVDKGSRLREERLEINSLGEGGIWISNINGNLENGDYITTCEIPGYGMKQDTEMLCNYTVAKITMDCNFDLDADNYECVEVEHEGTTYRAAFVGCTYHCG